MRGVAYVVQRKFLGLYWSTGEVDKNHKIDSIGSDVPRNKLQRVSSLVSTNMATATVNNLREERAILA